MKAFTTITTTIASSASLSGEISLDSWTLEAIIMPAAWTTANLTFQAAEASGGTYNNLYNDGGNEVTVTAAVDRYISLIGDDKDSLGTARWLKIRSGTGASAVNQGAERTIRLVLRKDW
tara:strand:- start:114 stop:470 length:357 start_codon:yes stop_codon:yes gene_type:complete